MDPYCKVSPNNERHAQKIYNMHSENKWVNFHFMPTLKLCKGAVHPRLMFFISLHQVLCVVNYRCDWPHSNTEVIILETPEHWNTHRPLSQPPHTWHNKVRAIILPAAPAARHHSSHRGTLEEPQRERERESHISPRNQQTEIWKHILPFLESLKSSQIYLHGVFLNTHRFKAALQKIMMLMFMISSCLIVAFIRTQLNDNKVYIYICAHA